MKVLIYDGDCNMCSRLIQFVVFINKDKNLHITDFNSQWTKENVDLNPNVDSLIFIDNNQLYYYSDAVIQLTSALHPLFKIVSIAHIVPKKLRDKLYRWIAKNRNRVFKDDKCKMPNDKFRAMYLA